MGHYDTCRDGYCHACGQVEGVIWGCGRPACSKYHRHLEQTGRFEELKRIKLQLKKQHEAAEEARVTKRQIQRRTTQIAQEAKSELDT